MIIESLVKEAMRSVRRKVPADDIRSKCGNASYNEAVRRVEIEPTTETTTQQFFAKQKAEKLAFFRNRTSKGIRSQRASQQDHDHIVNSILSIVNEGNKPAVPTLLEAYGTKNNRDPEWAKRVATQAHNKKMNKTFQTNKDHPVIQDLKDGRMFTQTHRGALLRSTYSGLAELLFSGSQIVRIQRLIRQQLDEMQEELAIVKIEVARANARLDDIEQWKNDAVVLYNSGKSLRNIAEKVGKAKSTVADYLNTLIKAGTLTPKHGKAS